MQTRSETNLKKSDTKFILFFSKVNRKMIRTALILRKNAILWKILWKTPNKPKKQAVENSVENQEVEKAVENLRKRVWETMWKISKPVENLTFPQKTYKNLNEKRFWISVRNSEYLFAFTVKQKANSMAQPSVFTSYLAIYGRNSTQKTLKCDHLFLLYHAKMNLSSHLFDFLKLFLTLLTIHKSHAIIRLK